MLILLFFVVLVVRHITISQQGHLDEDSYSAPAQ